MKSENLNSKRNLNGSQFNGLNITIKYVALTHKKGIHSRNFLKIGNFLVFQHTKKDSAFNNFWVDVFYT